MVLVRLPYGKGFVEARLEGFQIQVLQQKELPSLDQELELRKAANSPISSNGFLGFQGCEDLAIVVNDQTRPVPLKMVLSVLLSKLKTLNVHEDNIKILIGGGLHTDVGNPENLLGREIMERVGSILIHNAENKHGVEYLGSTKRQTPVWINRHFLEAEKKIVIGMIDPHQFVGYTGGAKGVSIGVAGYETIEKNHSLMLDRRARLGNITDNPVREDIDEIGGMVGIDMILNVILNRENQVIKAVAGHWFYAHRAGVEFAKKVFEVEAQFLADVVIASPGGYPKDLDVYQSQKSLSTSEIVCKPGGVIILVAECSQGLGSDEFEKAMKKIATPAEVVEYFKNTSFKMGLHKAYLWAKTLLRNRVIIVSDKLNDKQAEILKVKRVDTIEEALKQASRHTRIEKILVLPRATSIVPVL